MGFAAYLTKSRDHRSCYRVTPKKGSVQVRQSRCAIYMLEAINPKPKQTEHCQQMTIQFCNSCENLLPATQDLKTKCDCCGKVTNNALLGISNFSTTDHVPSALQNKPWINMPKNIPTPSMHKGKPIPQLPKADVKCHECDEQWVQYVALQLGDTDEGTRIYYSCIKCEARWQVDKRGS